ncbi:EF-hand domain-containing protein [Tropicimonas sp. IMCC6043]|uniref:EF-hand domain-containing protein n=1 Tax=Tropicimonas sp. IMCC6043 TaxID=2510645 RepID=UPI0013EB5F3D|nr:EF-hand domain-containing protein [Tropicimonas sp. IMCC6043]
MTRNALLTTAILAGLAATTGAEARGNAPAFGGFMVPAQPPVFAELDADADGKVTVEEFRTFGETRLTARFLDADTDGDGKLSAAELQAGMEAYRAGVAASRMQAMVARLDTDKDGLVSQEEFAALQAGRGQFRPGAADPGARMIARFDSDRDGALSETEFAAAQQMVGFGPRGGQDVRGMRGNFGNRGSFDGRGRGQRGDQMPFWRQ